ncbi:Gibberellin 20-oxidase [Melia azedarach]|uniref:Gibberellin 20-oxidase n=1 Tax=Melia azedarach TaxID=155640 RepID=A0ACC1YUC9_MELAZ|nr:Gibberellin 20-oxidase [Melia azedarach]
MDFFFGMPLSEKQKAQRKLGEHCGYASSFTGRFSSKLPWKETFSFRYCTDAESSDTVEKYIVSKMGEDFRQFGELYQEYCEAMSKLSLEIMELFGASLGVDREYFREFFKDNDSIMRLNYYPPCQKPDLALGTGPHLRSNILNNPSSGSSGRTSSVRGRAMAVRSFQSRSLRGKHWRYIHGTRFYI